MECARWVVRAREHGMLIRRSSRSAAAGRSGFCRSTHLGVDVRAEDKVPRSSWWRPILLICVGLLLTACTPPMTDAVIDLRIAEDGTVEHTYAAFEQGWSDPFQYGHINYTTRPGEEPEDAYQRAVDELDQVREACLDDGTCIRLRPGATIVESSDGFETTSTVWSVSPHESWLDLSHGSDGVRAVIEVYDILVMPDQTVRVAGGGLGVLHRSVDGAWSPAEADLQTLSKGVLGALLLAGMLVILMGAMVIAQLPGPHVESATTMAAVMLLPAALLVSWFLVNGMAGLGFLALTFPGVATVPVALGLVVFALNRERRFSGSRFFVVLLRSLAVAWAVFAVAAGVLYVLWSRAIIWWPVFLVGVHILAPIAAHRVARQVKELRAKPWEGQIQETELRNPIPIALAAVCLLLIGLPLLGWVAA